MILGIDVGICNFAYCVRDEHDGLRTIELLNLIDEYKTHSRRKRQFRTLTYDDVHRLIDVLRDTIFTDSFMKKYKINIVRIECFPSKSIKKLWLFAHLLFSFFRTRVTDTALVHGKKKLYIREELSLFQNIVTESDYRRMLLEYETRKELSVLIFGAYMKSQKINMDVLGSKLDDVADAFLLTYT
jgi:hypothetical protein